MSVFSRIVIQERGNKCGECGVPARQRKDLQIHHIYKQRTHRHLRFERSNMVVCCQKCHTKLEKVSDWLEFEDGDEVNKPSLI